MRLIESRLKYADYEFRILAEIDPNNPAIDRLIAEGVERVLAGPPYRGVQPVMLHYQRADLAIENAERLKGYAEEKIDEIGHPTSETLDQWRDLSNLQSGSAHALQIARIYQWADVDDPETVVGRVLAQRHEDHERLFRGDGLTRILQATRRRGLVDMFAERAREEIMAEDLGSDKTYRLSSILETLRANIDDELRRKIDDSMAERGRQIRERIRREREAAPDPS
ncbi:MAG: hypothetical protein EA376_11150 [Phycisphaeraceae bacterium]|nr:MAG: hypothetical protein EA376_11150 [Phycisphaeraceae bacterium]